MSRKIEKKIIEKQKIYKKNDILTFYNLSVTESWGILLYKQISENSLTLLNYKQNTKGNEASSCVN